MDWSGPVVAAISYGEEGTISSDAIRFGVFHADEDLPAFRMSAGLVKCKALPSVPKRGGRMFAE